eukprot:12191442-Alexandrium_andersonii.AAC.1
MELTLDMRILPWLVCRSAWCRTGYAAGSDGLMPYQRLYGAARSGTVATPGEIVMVKVASGKTRGRKLAGSWLRG